MDLHHRKRGYTEIATVSELTLKVEVQGDQLKVLSAQLNEIGKGGQKAGADAGKGFDTLRTKVKGTFDEIINFKNALLGIAAATGVVAFLSKITNDVAKLGNQLDLASRKTGLTSETLDKLRIIGKETNVSLEAITDSMRFLNIALSDLQTGGGSEGAIVLQEIAKQAKISTADLTDLNVVLPLVADAFFQITDAATQAQVAQALFGKSSSDVAILLEDFRVKGDQVKSVMSPGIVDASKQYEQASRDLGNTLEELTIKIGSRLLPALSSILESLNKLSVQEIPFLFTPLGALVHTFQNLGKQTKEAATGQDKLTESTKKGTTSLQDALETKFKDINASKAQAKGMREATSATDTLNDSLKKQIEQLQKANETFGLGKAALLAYEVATLKAKGASAALVEQFEALGKSLLFKETLASAVTAFGELEKELVVKPFEDLQGFMQNALKDITDNIKEETDLWTFIFADTFSTIIDNFTNFFVEGIFDGFDDITSFLKNLGKTVVGSILGTFNTLTAQIIGGLFKPGAPGVPGLAPGVPGALFGVSGITGQAGGVLGGLATALPNLFGSFAKFIPIIGTAIGFIGSIIPTIIGLFQSKPRGDITVGFVDKAKTQLATVAQILEAAGDLEGDLAQLVFRGGFRKVGFPGGFDAVRKILAEQATQVIESIQQTLGTLPTQLSKDLNTLLLETQLEVRGRLNEFHFKGKTVGDALKKFLEGEFQAEFIFSLNSFFSVALAGLGVNVEAAQKFVSDQLATFEGLKSREARAAFGKEFLAQFQIFVDAFNFLNDNLGDTISVAINQINSLSDQLGFEGIPTIEELKVKLRELFEAAELDPETIGKFIQLRNAIVQMGSAITGAIGNIVSFIDSLNAKITSLGGSSVSTSGALFEAIDATRALLEGGGLSLEEREALLRQMDALTDQLFAQGEQTAQIQDQQTNINQSRSDALEREKRAIQDIARVRLDALEEELQIAEDLTSLSEDIRLNIQDLTLGSASIDTPLERLTATQARIDELFGELSRAAPGDRADIGREIQDLLNTMLGTAGEAFQTPSPEFRDTFRNVIEQLEALQEMVEPARSVEEISAEIQAVNERMEEQLERIDRQIESARNVAQSIGQTQIQQTNKYSDEARAYYEYIRGEAVKILEARLQQLRDLGIGNLDSLNTMEAIGVTQIQVLREIRDGILGQTQQEAQQATQQVQQTQQATQKIVQSIANPTTTSPLGGIPTTSVIYPSPLLASTTTSPISAANPRTTNPLGGVTFAQSGFHGFLDRDRLFMAHRGERVDIEPQRGRRERTVNLNFSFSGGADKRGGREAAAEFIRTIKYDSEVRRLLGLN